MFKADDPSYVRTEVRKRLKDEMLRVVMAALDLGAPARLTSNGIVIAGDGGSATTHWTVSDYRGSRNLEAELRRIGYDLPRINKSTKQPGEKKKPPRKAKTDTFRPLPRIYEPQTRPTTVTWRPELPEPEPVELAHEPRQRREPGARASGLSSRVVHPRIAALYAQLPDSLRQAQPELLLAALGRAGNDPRRITADADGSLLIWNRPAW